MYKYINSELKILLWDTNSFTKRSNNVSLLTQLHEGICGVQLYSSIISALDGAERST